MTIAWSHYAVGLLAGLTYAAHDRGSFLNLITGITLALLLHLHWLLHAETRADEYAFCVLDGAMVRLHFIVVASASGNWAPLPPLLCFGSPPSSVGSS